VGWRLGHGLFGRPVGRDAVRLRRAGGLFGFAGIHRLVILTGEFALTGEADCRLGASVFDTRPRHTGLSGASGALL